VKVEKLNVQIVMDKVDSLVQNVMVQDLQLVPRAKENVKYISCLRFFILSIMK